MIDIQKVLNEQIAKYCEEELNNSIQKHLAVMMDKVLENVFSKRGDNNLSKEVEKQLKEWLKVNIWSSDLLQYNWMIWNAVAQYINKAIEERNVKPIISIVDAIVWKSEDWEVKSFDELIRNIKGKMDEEIEDDYHRKADDIWKDYPIYATYKMENGWIDIFCDDEMWEEKRNCTIKFSISSKTNTIFSVCGPSSRASRSFSKIESYINNLYLSQTKIQGIDWDSLENWDIELDVWSYDPY